MFGEGYVVFVLFLIYLGFVKLNFFPSFFTNIIKFFLFLIVINPFRV